MKISVDLFPPWVQKMTSPWWRLERSVETSAYLLSKLKLVTNNLHLSIHWSHWKDSVYTSRRGMLLWPEVCCFSCMNEQLKCAEMLLRKEFLVFLRALYSSQGPVFLITNNQPTVQFLCPTCNWNNTLLVITTILLLLCTYRVTTESHATQLVIRVGVLLRTRITASYWPRNSYCFYDAKKAVFIPLMHNVYSRRALCTV